MSEKSEKFYLVKINIYTEVETSNGGVKEKIEKIDILVKGVTVGDAETQAYKHFATGALTFTIVSVTESKITEVLNP